MIEVPTLCECGCIEFEKQLVRRMFRKNTDTEIYRLVVWKCRQCQKEITIKHRIRKEDRNLVVEGRG